MNRNLLTGIVAVGAVAALALLLRRFAGGERDETLPAPATDAEPDSRETEFDEAADDGEVIGVTSDGWKFVPDGAVVRLVPPVDPDAPNEGHTNGESLGTRVAETLAPGDLSGTRLKRDAAGAWRIEALGRDGEFRPFIFETADAARAVLAMLDRRNIVRVVRDDDGRPLPASDEAFEEAHRLYDETVRALAMLHDEEPPDA